MLSHTLFVIFCTESTLQWTDIATAWGAIITALFTIALVLVGIFQINKFREANNTQALEAIYNQFITPQFISKRKILAKFVFNFGHDAQSGQDFLKKYLKEQTLISAFSEDIHIVKNLFEDVIFLFQKIGYYSIKKKLFSIEDVYILFSYEIQRYWVLIENKIGYITYLRGNGLNGENDFYESFERIFYLMVVQQFISQHKELDELEKQFYLCYSNDEIKRTPKFKEIIDTLTMDSNIKAFLYEEMNLNLYQG